MIAIVGAAAAAFGADLTHTVALRYRRGSVPGGLIVDRFFFDADDEGALPYERPKVRANVFGLEYGLGLPPTGRSKVVGWIERIGIPLEAGYWDDRESPPDHVDGDWVEPEN